MSRRPSPPRHLNADAKAVWKRLLGELPDLEVGTLMMLEQFCFAWSRWLGSEDDDQRLRWSRACRQWAAELKLSPKTKSARKVTAETADPILRLIGNAD